MVSKYWFAKTRRNESGGRFQPVSREGYLVPIGFAAAMVVGGLAFLVLALHGYVAAGIIIFAFTAMAAATTFITVAVTRCDPVNTVADYREGRVKSR